MTRKELQIIPLARTRSGAGQPSSTKELSSLPPLSLYVHLPWCLRKCPYCDFNSHELNNSQQGVPESEYLRALELDLESALPAIWGRSVQTVFIGGGTPSLFSESSISILLESVRARLRIAPHAEITLEANPGTFEANKFLGFAHAGINRLSLGVQSLNDASLKRLGRVHDRAQAIAAAQLAARVYPTWNVDLMFALPEQTVAQACDDLDQVIELNPPHISLYHLTLEPNTEFARKPPKVPDDELAAIMQERLELRLAGAGYVRYEVSAWAKPGHESRHNRNYWEFGDYLGIGAGAHGKISNAREIIREVRWRSPSEYLKHTFQGSAISNRHVVTAQELPFEFMLNALRLVDGVPSHWFEERTGVGLVAIQKLIAEATDLGLLSTDPLRLKPTNKGLLFLNDLQSLFLTDDPI